MLKRHSLHPESDPQGTLPLYLKELKTLKIMLFPLNTLQKLLPITCHKLNHYMHLMIKNLFIREKVQNLKIAETLMTTNLFTLELHRQEHKKIKMMHGIVY